MSKKKTVLLLATIATATIHILNKLEYSSATMKNVLNSTENMYYEWRFGKIKYTKRGSGSPVLLIHDLEIGSSSYEFSKVEKELALNHEVYNIDLLGFGLSDKPNITFTNYLYVQMITDFIKNVVKKKISIVATGKSVPIAIMVCHNDSEHINNLVAINPQSLFQLNQIPSKQTKMLKILLDTPILGTFIYNLKANKNEITKKFSDEYYFNPYNITEEDIEAYVEAAHTSDFNSKHAYTSMLGRYTNTNIIHGLKEINNNIYIIASNEEPDIFNITENYKYYNNAMEISYIQGTKHLPQLEKPEEIISLLDIYL